MHPSAKKYGQKFFELYLGVPDGKKVLDVGAMDLNGSLRSVCPAGVDYLGVDLEAGSGVDVVLDNPYKLPLATDTFDACVCTSCFEHCELFWVLFLEIMRVTKPGGMVYINAPSNGPVHRHPVDCWRFYPDAGTALAKYASNFGYPAWCEESFVSSGKSEGWNDFVCVIVKRGDSAHTGIRLCDLVLEEPEPT